MIPTIKLQHRSKITRKPVRPVKSPKITHGFLLIRFPYNLFMRQTKVGITVSLLMKSLCKKGVNFIPN